MRTFWIAALCGWGGVHLAGPHWLIHYRPWWWLVVLVVALPGLWGRRRDAPGRPVWSWVLPLAMGSAHLSLQTWAPTLRDLPATPVRQADGWPAADSRDPRSVRPTLEQAVRLEGHVCGNPGEVTHEFGRSHQRVTFCISSVVSVRGGDVILRDRRVTLDCHACALSLNPGSVWRVEARVASVRPRQNPGDGLAWQRQWRQGAWRGTIKSLEPLASDQCGHACRVEQWRERIRGRLRQAAADIPYGTLLSAMILGDDQGLKDTDWDLLRRSGLLHLVVVSGLHVGIIAALCLAALQGLGRAARIRSVQTLAVCGTLLGLVGFLALVGIAVPVFRATLMAAVVLLLSLTSSRLARFDIYGLAVLGTLLVDPLAFVSPGFWLSFLAVLVLGLSLRTPSAESAPPGTGRTYADRWHRAGRHLLRGAAGLATLQARLTLALLPVVGFFYEEYSVVSWLLNLLAVPLVTLLIMPLGVLLMAVLAVSEGLAALILGVLGPLLQGFWWLAELSVPVPMLPLPPTPWPTVALVMALILVQLRLRQIPLLAWSWVGVACLVAGPAGEPGAALRQDRLSLTMLDVGQGLALVVRQAEEVLVYDAGYARPGGRDEGEAVVAPYLRRQGIDRAELLVVSHGDADHAGGVPALLSRVDFREVLLGEPERVALSGGSACARGQVRVLGSARLTLLWPDPERTAAFQGNDRSCTVLIEYGGRRALLTGDLEVRAQQRLLDQWGQRLRADVLVLPHHGGRSSFLPEFLSAVSPRLVLVSAGHRNRFGHPHPLVVAWLQRRGIPLINTGWQGAATLSWDRQGAPDLRVHGLTRPAFD